MTAEGISASVFQQRAIGVEAFKDFLDGLGRMGGVGLDPANRSFRAAPRAMFESAPSNEVLLIEMGAEELLITPALDDGHIAFDLSLDYSDVERNRSVAALMLNIVEYCIGETEMWWFAYVDIEGDPPKNLYSDVRKARLRTFFWANYFSAGYFRMAGFNEDGITRHKAVERFAGGWRYLTRTWFDEEATASEEEFLRIDLGAGASTRIYRPQQLR
jgi:hypothetical protein